MKSHAQFQLDLVNHRRAQELAEAALARQLSGRVRPTRYSVSQVLARIGARLPGGTRQPVGQPNSAVRVPNIGRSPDVATDL